ncbi:hypothetical protein D3Z38_04175 [Clostridiales bacterium]|nr:hypothetical protein [Clostridiales bacterium]
MYIADLHIHSKYSRATSRECVPEYLDLWAGRKGIHILGTGDFTHPVWRQELKEKLEPVEEGFYKLKHDFKSGDSIMEPRFVVSGEISSIYKKNGKTRKVHNLILLPGLEEAEQLSRRLEAIGNIHSDGRPILGLDSRDLLEITLETCPKAIFIPAHIWTPHFSLFGAFSGFDTIDECFEDLTGEIHALETGLSSDPPMNWRLSALDPYNLVSNSDAHSPAKLGREANLLDIPLSYTGLYQAIQEGKGLEGTIEFFPEEGKYHMDGHRKCDLCLSPLETKEHSGTCPVCGKKITIGVLHRIEELADRPEDYQKPEGKPFESLVPLQEVIAASTDKSPTSVKVKRQYDAMIKDLGPEFSILRDMPLEEIKHCAGPCIEEGIRRLRQGKVERIPGYDGEYGKIKIIRKEEIEELCGQVSLFESIALPAGAAKKKVPKKKAAQAASVAAQASSALCAPAKNLPQQKAITSSKRFLAVIAGPGTGKTYTLVHRIQHLIQQQGVKPVNITAVTFTNKAAAELRLRLQALLGKRKIETMTIGTFHAICLKRLKNQGQAIRLADEQKQLKIAGSAAKELDLNMSPAALLRQISLLKNSGQHGETAPELLSAQDAGERLAHEARELYDEKLRAEGLLDFDDLLRRALELPTAKDSLLLVDEFQDISPLQYQLIQEWSKGSLFVIGDPDQSIYGFRGSDARCFQRLRQDYPQMETIRLETNYRSTAEILDCALPVINHNPGSQRRLKALGNSGQKPYLIKAESDLSEAIFIAQEINRMTGGMDMMDAQNYAVGREIHRSFSDIAVLYRTRQQAKILENCLQKESVPYTVTGKEAFLDDPVVKGAIAFFRWLLQSGELPTDIFETDPEETCRYLAEQISENIENQAPAETLKEWSEKAGFSNHAPLKQLAEMALFYDHMKEFLDNLLLGEEQDLKRNAAGKLYKAGTVSLMTLHGAKGLEFPVVFLCGLKEDRFPVKSGDLEEERRLFYVGMTRAKEELLLLTAGEPSPFIAEIPQTAMERQEAYQRRPESKDEQLSIYLP